MEFTKGDLLRADTEAIVNTVNCVGVMGRGLAAQFKRAYPENFKAYEAACQRKEVVPGKMFIFETGQLTNPLGSGLGGLAWRDVRPLIERAFAGLPGVRALVFAPNADGLSDKMARAREVAKIESGSEREEAAEA